MITSVNTPDSSNLFPVLGKIKKKELTLPKINSSMQDNQSKKNKIVIDLQKEYDEDKEFIDMLNDLCKISYFISIIF